MAFAKVFIFMVVVSTECIFCFGYTQDRIKREDANAESSFSEQFSSFLNSLFGGEISATNTAVPVTTETKLQQRSTTYSSTIVSSEADFTIKKLASQQSPISSVVVTTPSAEEMCLLDPILQDFCEIPEALTGVTFFDLYSLLFSDTVLDGLLVDCRPGDWCLRNRFDYWNALIMEKVDMIMNSIISVSVCETGMEECLSEVTEKYSNCSAYSTMRFTAQSINLLCRIKVQNTEEECYKRVLSTLHISLADLLRELGTNISDSTAENICQTAKYEMTKNYVCMTNSCSYQSNVLISFPFWGWFIADVPIISSECQIKTCESLNQVESTENPTYSTTSSMAITSDGSDLSQLPSYYDDYYNDMNEHTTTATSTEYTSTMINAEEGGSNQVHVIWVYDSDVQLMIGISMTMIVGVTVMVAGFCICWRRRQLLAVNRDGYTQLRSEDNELYGIQ